MGCLYCKENFQEKQCPPLGNSLKYYRTSFVGDSSVSQATDNDKTILAQKAGCLLALAENTLYETMKTENYQISRTKTTICGRLYISRRIIDLGSSMSLWRKWKSCKASRMSTFSVGGTWARLILILKTFPG